MYGLLAGVRVLDVSILAPAIVGMNLADLGADVIKIEPPGGDHIRGAPGRLHEEAPSFSHLRWNRGKRSLQLDLKKPGGVALFLELAAESDLVIEGLRAGTMDRLGVGYAVVQAINPRVVFCSISGTGRSGPYARLGMHGAGLDAFAGVAGAAYREDGKPYIADHVAFGSRVGPLYAAYAAVAALLHATRTGEGSYVEVAETDAAVFASADPLLYYLNTGQELPSDIYKDITRNNFYATSDGKLILFACFEYKFWQTFCEAVGRGDLIARGGDPAGATPNTLSLAAGDEALREELSQILGRRTQREWVDFFIEHNIPGGPANSVAEMAQDPHFKARDLVLEQEVPDVGTVRMPTTPIKVEGAEFAVRPAPKLGEHSAQIVREVLGYDDERIKFLTQAGIIR